MSDQQTSDAVALKVWEDRIKEIICGEIGKIVDKESAAAAARVQERVSKSKVEIISKVVDRLRLIQRHSPAELRFEILIQER